MINKLPIELQRHIYSYVLSYSFNIINSIRDLYVSVPINAYENNDEFINKENLNIVPSKYIQLNKILVLYNIDIQIMNSNERIFILSKIINFNYNTFTENDNIRDAICDYYQHEYFGDFEDDDNLKLYYSMPFDERITILPLLKDKFSNNTNIII
jgi:exonuclease I